MRNVLIALVLAVSTSALAEDSCKVEVGPKDVVKKTGDVVIEPGQDVEGAFALDGKVVIKKGAKVSKAVAFHGDVVVEDAAKVTDAALSIGGTVKTGKGAVVKSIVQISDSGVRVKGEDGEDVDVNLSIGGKSLAQKIADEALGKLKDCRVVAKK